MRWGASSDRLPAGWWYPSAWRRLRDEQDWPAIAKRLFILCWPLVATVVTIVLWKVLSPEPAASLNHWRWEQKARYFMLTLRDQSMLLDAVTTFSCIALILFGWVLGARWKWQLGLPGLLVFLLF